MKWLASVLWGCVVPITALGSSNAAACSPPFGYHFPNNLELVAEADVIALARVSSGPDISLIRQIQTLVERRSEMPTVKFDLFHLLKGRAPEKRVEKEYAFLVKSAEGISDPNELQLPHPDSYSGACTRSLFVWNSTVLLIMKRDKSGILQVMDTVFGRVSEDVSGLDARWTRAVIEYLKIARLPRNEWTEALRERAAVLSKNKSDSDAIAIAADMSRMTNISDGGNNADQMKRQLVAQKRYRKVMRGELPEFYK